jgi:cytochrome c553
MSAREVSLTAAGFVLCSAIACAQDGAAIATQGAGANAPACASCHGAQGEGNAASNFPRLAGQADVYLVRQLDAYADGHRQNPIMSPIAKALTGPQRAAVASYYAQLPVAGTSGAANAKGGSAANGKGSGGGTAAASTAANAKGATATSAATSGKGANAARAERLANVGDEQLRVQACANCHGAGGRGEPPSYPYLATQHAGYFRDTLAAWKAGTRNTDPSGNMTHIAKQLSDADVAALAQYFAAQPVPDTLELTMREGRIPTLGAGTTTPTNNAPSAEPTRPAGTEQGSPTTGGTQGQGGNSTQGRTAPGGTSPAK